MHKYPGTWTLVERKKSFFRYRVPLVRVPPNVPASRQAGPKDSSRKPTNKIKAAATWMRSGTLEINLRNFNNKASCFYGGHRSDIERSGVLVERALTLDRSSCRFHDGHS
ncbi:hypothetical protein RCL_jg15816.t1 [Rhizophagus clarus]|uniref:Uncharacterized protein n=1 Tax=Rhizophagus clarus TaxID=94130 RepID=A0A8H3M7K1_9GLOM|nr:hypothetical protein RCL_jg15816.t1 [Rhizophagus clarus]